MNGGEYRKKENIYSQIIKHTEYLAELVKIHQFLVTVVKLKMSRVKIILKTIRGKRRIAFKEIAIR